MKIKNSILNLGLLLLILLTNGGLMAQDKQITKKYRIETSDGNSYLGKLMKEDSLKVLILTDKLGELSILKSDLKSMVPLEDAQIKAGKVWLPNPQSTRYFYSPNGYGLKGGEAYYQNVWVLINSFAVGINNYVSIGGGLIPTFLFNVPTPAWLTVKLSIPAIKDKLHFGAGVLAGTVLGANSGGIGIFYGIATLGNKDSNISLGTGYGYADGSMAQSPVFNLCGMLRIGPKGYILTENYLFPGADGGAMLSLGGRTVIRETGLDYGLFFPTFAESGFVAIPWLGLTIPLGRKK